MQLFLTLVHFTHRWRGVQLNTDGVLRAGGCVSPLQKKKFAVQAPLAPSGYLETLFEWETHSAIHSRFSVFCTDLTGKFGNTLIRWQKRSPSFSVVVCDIKSLFMALYEPRIEQIVRTTIKQNPLRLKFNIWFYSIYKHLTHFSLSSPFGSLDYTSYL